MPWSAAKLARAGSLIVIVLASIVSIRLFMAIDSQASSVSDTLLGFVPSDLVVWALALAGVWAFRRAGRSAR